MHRIGIIALNHIRGVAITSKQGVKFVPRNPAEERRPGNLVAVQVQNRQHRAVVHWIQKFIRVPAGGQRSGFRFAIADYAGDD